MTATDPWWSTPAKTLDSASRERAENRQQTLTKPPGSLGQLETLAAQFAAWQGCERPQLNRVDIAIFAADHGVCAQNISAFPQSVTRLMVDNFLQGGAAISVLARALDAQFQVVNCGVIGALPAHPKLIDRAVAAGTADFSRGPAMRTEQLEQALAIGRERVQASNAELFIGGEMGIGNTTAASALMAALLELPVAQCVGPGTGLAAAGVAHKRQVVTTALEALAPEASAWQILQHLGGLEIAALTGAYIACAQRGLPALVDGFICSVAALCAERLCPGTRDWLLFAHSSAEPGHRHLLEALQQKPLLDLGMRLGEASGAAVAVPLLQAALKLHNEMATFSEAGIA